MVWGVEAGRTQCLPWAVPSVGVVLVPSSSRGGGAAAVQGAGAQSISRWVVLAPEVLKRERAFSATG